MGNTEHLFISDVHLGAFSPQEHLRIENDLQALIHYATQQRAKLYVLGDLFDYWMEFPNSSFLPDIGINILNIFERYNREVGPALFITGNHDNWTLNHFVNRGFDVEHDYRLITIDSKQVLLMHGDGKMTPSKTLQRPILHRILRNKHFLSVYRALLPEQTALNVMKSFSALARRMERIDPTPLSKNAAWILEHFPADVVLSGHDHIPRVEQYPKGMYINTGTFFHHKTLVRYVNGTFNLVYWKSAANEFIPFS